MLKKFKSLTSYHYVTYCLPIFLVTISIIVILLQPIECLQDTLQETSCLNCIRNITSVGVDPTKRCVDHTCGLYQFSYQYWAEAGKPADGQGNRNFEKCARDRQCAEQTVRAYFKKFRRDCNNDGYIDCLDMAALHKYGPTSCSSDWLYKSRFWLAFNRTECAQNQRDYQPDGSAKAASRASAADNLDKLRHQLELQQSLRVMKNQSLTSECLECICDATSGCNTNNVANCGHGTVCGPFAISQAYWKDGRRPGASWTACTRTKECSIVTIKNYMEKHQRDCNGDGFVTCEDYAAIHRRGPKSCLNRDLLKEQYWSRFLACRANQKPSIDVNTVKVNEDAQAQLGSLSSRLDQMSTTLGQQQASSTGLSAIIVSSSSTIAPSTIEFPSKPSPTSPISTSTTSTTTNTPITSSTAAPIPVNAFDRSTQREPPSNNLLPEGPTYELTSIMIDVKGNDQHQQQQHVFKQPPAAAPQQQNGNPAYDQYPRRYSTMSSHQTTPVGFKESLQTMRQSETMRPLFTLSTYQDTTMAQSPMTTSSPTTTTAAANNNNYNNNRRPTFDYSSLPTIIISKPLGGSQSMRLNPPISSPPVLYSTTSTTTTTTTAAAATRLATTQPPTTPTTMMMTTAAPPATTTSTTIAPPATSTVVIDTTDLPHQTLYASTRGSQAQYNQDNGGGHHQDDGATSLSSSYPPLESANYPLAGESTELDYPGAEYPYQATGAGSVGGNFDKVVSGIMTNTDFSKSYPPVPDISLVDQKPGEDTTNPTPPPPQAIAPNRIQPKIIQSNQAHQSNQASRGPPASVNKFQEMAKTSTSGTTSGGSQTTASAADHQRTQATGGGGGGGSIVGVDSLNMTNLFDGGLNESSRIASECLECICDASSNCDPTVQCISKQREKNRCGLYMISWNQYQESDISLTSLATQSSGLSSEDYDEKMYYDCTTDKNCAEKLIHLYIEKHQRDCNNDGKIDCFDIAAIHRVGPDNCNSGKFLSSQYWKDFNICYATDRLTAAAATTTTSALTSSSSSAAMTTTSTTTATLLPISQSSH